MELAASSGPTFRKSVADRVSSTINSHAVPDLYPAPRSRLLVAVQAQEAPEVQDDAAGLASPR